MHKDELARFESIGPEGVLREIAEGRHGPPTSPARDEVEAWLHPRMALAEAAASARRDSMTAEAISIAKEANAIARFEAAAAARSARWAMYAAIIAATGAAIAAKDEILRFMFGNL